MFKRLIHTLPKIDLWERERQRFFWCMWNDRIQNICVSLTPSTRFVPFPNSVFCSFFLVAKILFPFRMMIFTTTRSLNKNTGVDFFYGWGRQDILQLLLQEKPPTAIATAKRWLLFLAPKRRSPQFRQMLSAMDGMCEPPALIPCKVAKWRFSWARILMLNSRFLTTRSAIRDFAWRQTSANTSFYYEFRSLSCWALVGGT